MLVALFSSIPPAFAAPAGTELTHIVAFGDSLSSGGWGSGPSTGPEPTADNGGYPRQTWIEQLSEMAGLGVLVRWGEGGNNYAVGGTSTVQLAEQVKRYLSANGGKASPTALHSIWSGANDFTHRLRDMLKEGGLLQLMSVGTEFPLVADKAVERLEQQIARLAEAGATHFFWVNQPDLSRTPSLASRMEAYPQLAGMAETTFREATNRFNARMEEAAVRLRARFPRIDLVTLDAHARFDDIIANPAAYGFTDVRTPSKTSNRHLFFDLAHPTSHGHYEFARLAYDLLRARGLANGAGTAGSQLIHR